jgi:hypothetical protein
MGFIFLIPDPENIIIHLIFLDFAKKILDGDESMCYYISLIGEI